MGGFDEKQLFASTVTLSDELGYRSALDALCSIDAWGIELGYPGDIDTIPTGMIRQTAKQIICHNYFIPADRPFILNLASDNDKLRRRSVNYVKRAIIFCDAYDIGLYTFHAGFRVDPTLDLTFYGEPTDRELAHKLFRDSVVEVAAFAAVRNITLGIENNVIEAQHLNSGRNDFILYCKADDFIKLFESLSAENVGLLLDVGHLRVAANTLGFDPNEFGGLSEEVVAIHVHENDGRSDRHDSVEESGWTRDFINRQLSETQAPIVIESHFNSISRLREAGKRLLR
jgi:sugar phosphate isomerase/epimerase